jgi:SSS family solute:Na+ symporter
MNYLTTDAIIVYAFLLITLAVGLWAGRNVKNIKEYAVANKPYGVGVLTMTMLATFITGNQAIGYVGYVFDDGILPLMSILFCGIIICFLFIARYIAPNIHYFEGCLTMAELMGRLYGSKARLWIGILGVFYCLVMVTLQIVWLGYIGELIDIPSQWAIILGGVFLVAYSARGGMKSVAITDVLQFITITILIPLVASIVISRVGSIHDIFIYTPSNTFDIIHHPSLKDYFVYCIWGLFPAFLVSFPFMQRMLMAKDKRQIANTQYIGIFYLTAFYVLLTLIGLAAIALKNMGDMDMPVQGSKIFIYLVKMYLPIGLKGIVGAGLVAAVMSTADSFLHSAGLLMAHDVIEPICIRRHITVNIFKLSQYATLLLGILALVIALTHQILPRIQYGGLDLGKGINISIDFIAIVFTTPLIAGIMGLKTDAKSFFISFIATIISFFLGKLFLPNLYFIPFNIFINAISFFGAHLIQNKRFVIVKRKIARLV